MKKITLSLILAFASISMFAQAHLAFKIGGNFDYLEFVRDDSSAGAKQSPVKFGGGHFGMAMDVPLYEDIISFSPELQFLAKSTLDEQIQNVSAEVQLPLPFSCYITTKFGVDLGPGATYRVLDITKVGENWEANLSQSQDLDFGIVGGARYKFTDNAMIVGRYYFGLRKLWSNSTAAVPYGVYNRSFQLSYIYSGGGRGY